MYTLAIAAIFRDEAKYLKEWIEFHRAVGVEYFYLMDNLSEDNFVEVLLPYISQGIVELSSWPFEHAHLEEWNAIQVLCYKEILKKASKQVKWLAFLDTDEFLFPSSTDNLVDFLANYEDCSGIGVNWQVFGTSNVAKIPENKLLIETLTWKLPEDAPTNLHIKSIVRPSCVVDCINPHFMIYSPGKFQVNSDKVRFEGAFSPYVQIKDIRINHYRLRDEHFYHNVKLQRRKKWQCEEMEFEQWYYNQIADEAILRFLPRLANTK